MGSEKPTAIFTSEKCQMIAQPILRLQRPIQTAVLLLLARILSGQNSNAVTLIIFCEVMKAKAVIVTYQNLKNKVFAFEQSKTSMKFMPEMNKQIDKNTIFQSVSLEAACIVKGRGPTRVSMQSSPSWPINQTDSQSCCGPWFRRINKLEVSNKENETPILAHSNFKIVVLQSLTARSIFFIGTVNGLHVKIIINDNNK